MSFNHRRNWPRTALAGLGILGGMGAAVASYAYFREPFALELEQRTIHLPRAAGRLPRQGLRLLHLSDSHFQGLEGREAAKITRIARLLRDVPVDLIVHTGDFLHNDKGLESVLALYDALPRPTIGSFAVLGNHDYAVYDMGRALSFTWRRFLVREARNGHPQATADIPLFPAPPHNVEQLARYLRFGFYLLHNPIEGRRSGSNDIPRLVEALQERGVVWLNNRSVHLGELSGQPVDLRLAGIDDLYEGQPDLPAALSARRGDELTILLSHNPDVLLAEEANQADLLLAGHTHGGQIVLPLVGPAHTQSEHLSRREASGHFRRGALQIYINRGIGESIPLRFGAPPQISLLTLVE